MAPKAETGYRHGSPARVGVLVMNLGTPEAPTAAALRTYLAEFLSDPRVVEISPVVWQLILHGLILRTRPAKSAKKYAAIWSPDGSPLMVWSRRQAMVLQGTLGERGKAAGLPADHIKVELAMRYGNPSVASGLQALREAGCDRIFVFPLYPQYAAATTASACDAVFAQLQTFRRQPAVRTLDAFHDDPGYIRALAARCNDYWIKHGRPDRLLLSFHGVPRFSLDKGDPYHCHCQKTARLLGTELGLMQDVMSVSFQSRFGRAEWLKPYTSVVLRDLGKQKVQRVDVFCPGFVADCLETLEEIAIEGKHDFVSAGGGELRYIPALNDHPAWYKAMGDIAWAQLGGWLGAPASAMERELQADRARKLGASN
ncbi:MAG: ferrochelatase [Betaproteobacteria bacterium]